MSQNLPAPDPALQKAMDELFAYVNQHIRESGEIIVGTQFGKENTLANEVDFICEAAKLIDHADPDVTAANEACFKRMLRKIVRLHEAASHIRLRNDGENRVLKYVNYGRKPK
jgi:hypothetical protein